MPCMRLWTSSLVIWSVYDMLSSLQCLLSEFIYSGSITTALFSRPLLPRPTNNALLRFSGDTSYPNIGS